MRFMVFFLCTGFLRAATGPLWPMGAGSTWTLKSPYYSQPATFTVTSDTYPGGVRISRIDVQSPWGNYGYYFMPGSNGIQLDGFVMNSASYHFDLPSDFFKYTASPGDHWPTAIGDMTLVSNTTVVATPLGRLTGIYLYRLTASDGSVQDWYLAPSRGLVQYGSGTQAFALASCKLTVQFTPPAPVLKPSACPRFGIVANPAAGGDFSATGQEYRLWQAVSAGSRHIHLTATWHDLEPKPQSYNIVQFYNEYLWAMKYGLTATLTIRVIDSNVLALPDDLIGRPLDDPLVISRFKSLLTAFLPFMSPPVQWVNLSTETDIFLQINPSQIAPFQTFYQAAYSYLHSANPSLSVGLLFAYNSTRRNDGPFLQLQSKVDHVAFTYYPMDNSNHPKPLWVIARDFDEMITRANGRNLVIVEIGMPSSEALLSSTTLQQNFLDQVITNLKSRGGKISAASFFMMSDPDPTLVSDLAVYYGLTADGGFSLSLATNGLFDTSGNPKPAWSVFQTRAPELIGSGCTTY